MNHDMLLKEQNMSLINCVIHESIEKAKNLANQPTELHDTK